ncbi:MAG: hypothetical protein AB9834_22095 [Lentimicrobium sp.]
MSKVIIVSFLKRNSIPFVLAGMFSAGLILMVFSAITSLILPYLNNFRFVQPDMRTIYRFLHFSLSGFSEVRIHNVHFNESV